MKPFSFIYCVTMEGMSCESKIRDEDFNRNCYSFVIIFLEFLVQVCNQSTSFTSHM